MAQRRPRVEVHSGRGHHGLRHEGRRGAHSAGRVRGLPLKTDLCHQVLGNRSHVSWRRLSPAAARTKRILMTARVLVVDDLFPNVKLLEAKLTAEYFDVLTAMNGPDALAICEQGSCDIVLLDVMMPGMNGFEVCRRLKNAPVAAHLPVVMVTALDQPSDRLM